MHKRAEMIKRSAVKFIINILSSYCNN